MAGGSTAAETLLQHQDILTVLLQAHRVGLHILYKNTVFTHCYAFWCKVGLRPRES